jgi:hypothetical protein
MAKTSRSSAQTGRTPIYGRNGANSVTNAFLKVCKLLLPIYDDLMINSDTDEGVVEEDRENMTTKPIPVHLDADGFPELPPTTSNDLHKTKIIQSMLREYCTAHIREIHFNLLIDIFLTYMSKASSLERKHHSFHGVLWL